MSRGGFAAFVPEQPRGQTPHVGSFRPCPCAFPNPSWRQSREAACLVHRSLVCGPAGRHRHRSRLSTISRSPPRKPSMSLAVLHSRALDGLAAPEVTVEVHIVPGLPRVTLVGLADTEVKEARERVHAALVHSGLEFPHNKRITVNLAPADLPKESGRFDLPIALGILAASGQIDADRLAGYEFAGELSLAGDLRPVRGALAMALALRRRAGSRALVLPEASACEAAL